MIIIPVSVVCPITIITENKPFEPDLDNASVGKMNYITKLCISLYCISIINAQISGIVVDAYSEQRIEGVNITSESLGTTTNADGEFQLDVNEI